MVPKYAAQIIAAVGLVVILLAGLVQQDQEDQVAADVAGAAAEQYLETGKISPGAIASGALSEVREETVKALDEVGSGVLETNEQILREQAEASGSSIDWTTYNLHRLLEYVWVVLIIALLGLPAYGVGKLIVNKLT